MSLTNLCSTSSSLSQIQKDVLGGQLLLGHISATEAYFRNLLGATVLSCHLTAQRLVDRQIRFGAVQYYAPDALGYALSERDTFTEKDKIKQYLNQVFGVVLKSETTLAKAVSDFEQFCAVRHALVHSHGRLNSQNAYQLVGDASLSGALRVNVTEETIQIAAVVCRNVVREVNQAAAVQLCWTWIVNRLITGDKRRDRRAVRNLRRLFISEVDMTTHSTGAGEEEKRQLDEICSVAKAVNPTGQPRQ